MPLAWSDPMVEGRTVVIQSKVVATVAKMTNRDIPAVCEIDSASGDEHAIHPKTVQYHLGDKSSLKLVATIGGKVVGFLLAEADSVAYPNSPLWDLQLTKLVVRPELRRKGIGERLMESLLTKARGTSGYMGGIAWLGERNVTAQCYLRKMGWQCVHEFKNTPGEDSCYLFVIDSEDVT